MERLTKAVSDHRTSKDVSKISIMETVLNYRTTIEELLSLHERVTEKVPALEDYLQRKRKAEKKDWKKQVVLILIGTAFGIIVPSLWTWVSSLLSSMCTTP